jgi:predicted nucleic acid-binding protein
MILIDTSAFLALLDMKDIYHERATQKWITLLREGQECITNNYIVLESIAVIQKRLGLEAIQELTENILEHLQIIWVDEAQHRQALETVIFINRRQLSLVDCTAFQTMRHLRIETAFTFDSHFRDEGFNVIP